MTKICALACALAVLYLSAAPARAQAMEVTGVSADDVLNLRAEPHANAPLTGALAPTATGVEIERRSGNWVYVKSGQQAGWASARYLRPAMSFTGKPPTPLKCGGTEPFWLLAIDGNRATFETPQQNAIASDIHKIEQSQNSTIVWLVRPVGGPVLSATIEARQACSDNMSDRIYGFSVRIETRNGELLSGCCDPGR